MYVVYTLKNEYEFLTKTVSGISSPIGLNETEEEPLLRNRAKAVFKDLVTILTAQEFDGAPMALSPLCDISNSEFIQDYGPFNSFLEPLTVNESYLDFPLDSGAQQPFKTDDVSNFGARTVTQRKGYSCAAYLKFNASIVPDNDPIPAYLYVQVTCVPLLGAGSRTPAYYVYFSLCNDTSEFTIDNFIGTAGKYQGGITGGPKVSAFSFRSSLNAIELGYTEGLRGSDGVKLSLIISMSSPETSASGGHLLVMPKVETPVSDPSLGDYINIQYNKANTVFFMSRYEPIDHWYNTAQEKIQGMLPWAVLSLKPGGTRYSSNAAGQSLNIFHTGTQLITASTSGAKDVCLLKLTASSATLSTSGGAFYGNKISDKVKADAINLIGFNVQPTSAATVLLGKVSGVSGVYYVAGDGIPYGDVISAINTNNYNVNYIVLPAEPYTVGATDNSVNVNKLKLAIPLV